MHAMVSVVDGVGLPEVGWTTGWVLLIFFVVQFSRGKLLTEKDHLERMGLATTLHEAAITAKNDEIDRVEHDRQEWRTESRIKDSVISELNVQAKERDRQLAQVGGEVARTLDSVLNAIRPLPGGPQ